MRTNLWLTKCNVAKFNDGQLKAFRRLGVPVVKSTALEDVTQRASALECRIRAR